jgi:hypothetical protein
LNISVERKLDCLPIPTSNTHRLFSPAVPLRSDDREKRQTSSLKETKKKTSCQKTSIVVASSHTGLGSSPSEDEAWHQNPVWNLHHQVAAEGQPSELGDGGHGADKRVLVTGEVTVLPESPNSTIAEDRFVEDLEEVNPDENREDVLVGLAANALALFKDKSQQSGSIV